MATSVLLRLIGVFSLCTLVRTQEPDETQRWSYDVTADGPAEWARLYPHCAGQKQSPINIEPANAVNVPLLRDLPIRLHGYNKPLTGSGVYLKNTGHTVLARVRDYRQHVLGITGAALPFYVLDHIQFHWGSTNSRGSEHTVNGKAYAMELHLVHVNKLYQGNDTAIDSNKDGLATLVVLIEVGDHNPAFETIVANLASTSLPDADDLSVPITLPALRDFLPADLTRYYRYFGSQTSPSCLEDVIWTIFSEPMQISQQQIDAFRNKLVKDKSQNRTPSSRNLIRNNFRPVMPLNGRTVYASFHDQTSGKKHSWGYYGTHGLAPRLWSVNHKQCGGKYQSPIHLKHSHAIYSSELSASQWELQNYDRLPANAKTVLQNNGHTFVVQMGDGIRLSGGGLPAEYRLEQFHMHWGSHNTNGSEHLLDFQQYPAEIHLVHTNMYYGHGKNFDAIFNNRDGLAVLGMFVEIGEHNPGFDAIIDGLSAVKYVSASKTVDLKLKSIRFLLPDDMSEFFRYEGSLTTPPCAEIVVWTVFKNTIKISQQQLNRFRTQVYTSKAPSDGPGKGATHNPDTLEEMEEKGNDDDEKPAAGEAKEHAPEYIVDNFRPLQKLGYRVVRYAKMMPVRANGIAWDAAGAAHRMVCSEGIWLPATLTLLTLKLTSG